MNIKPDNNYLKKELYELIKKDENIFDFIQESSLDGMWYWDLENPENEWMSDRLWTTLGYNPEEMPHKTSAWQTIINQDDLKIAIDNFNKHCEDPNHPYDQIVRYTHKNGSVVWIRCRGLVIRDETGKPVRMLGAHHDVTKLKELEKKLIHQNKELDKKVELRTRELQKQNTEYAILNEEYKTQNEELIKAKEKAEEREHQIKAMFNAVPDLIFRISIDGIFLSYKADIEDLYYKQDNFIGKKYHDVLPDYFANILSEKIKLAIETDKLQTFTYSLEIPKFGKKIYEARMSKSGKNETTTVVRDITEQESDRIELIKAKQQADESNKLKTEFINNMSHEIRTPMNGILGFSKLLDNKNLSSKKRKHFTSIIQNSGNQLMRIIDDILEISKLGTKQVEAVEKEICLNEMLFELFSVFDIKAKENNTPLYFKKGLSDIESTILTDETKLNKILSNLIENALKFTNTGFIEFGYQKRKTELEIYIKDTGIGINQEKQETIFERFSQAEKELSKNVGGLGLGLSIANENAELLGGKITLKSEKGKGSTFFVTIPYKPVNSESEILDKNKEINTEKQDKYTILIVEDEEVNYLFIETLLEDVIKINCNILHAKQGKEAVDLCTENSEIDYILMDLKMPIMNGFEATKLIKKFKPDLPIVAQTAYTTNQDKEKAFTAGCDDFISKPINKELLNETINKYLVTK